MNIHQFNLQFSPEQDRIVFRINTINKEEFRFYLTRRYVKLLWPVLMRLLENDYKRREPDKSHMSEVMLEFEQEKVVSKADFKQEYAEDIKTHPLGEETILLSQIKVKPIPNGEVLCMLPSDGKGIEFQVNNKFLHTFCKMLRDMAAKAEWDLDSLFQDGPKPQSKLHPTKRVLH